MKTENTLLPLVFCHKIPTSFSFTPATLVIFVSVFGQKVVCIRDSVSAAVTPLWTVVAVLPLFDDKYFQL